MNLEPSEDQLSVSSMVEDICRDHCGPEVIRQHEVGSSDFPESLWGHLRDGGLLGSLVPEEHGGSGLSMLINTAIYEQFGRALAPIPHFVSSVVGALCLLKSDNTALCGELLPKICSGDSIVTPAWLEPGSGYGQAGVQLAATVVDGCVSLNGVKRHVFYAEASQYFLVLGRESTDSGHDEFGLFLVNRDSPGITLQREESIASDHQYRVTFDNVTVDAESSRIFGPDNGWEHWVSILNEAIILDSAYTVGLAERAQEITIAYAKEREQFGKPIGSFQAISHYLADGSTLLAGAKTLVYEAAWAHSAGKPYQTLAAMASYNAGKVARTITSKSQQIHGGIGFTLDYDIQLFFRRAKQQQINWWDSRYLEEVVASNVLDCNTEFSIADPFIEVRNPC